MYKKGGFILFAFLFFNLYWNSTHANTLIERTISWYSAKVIEYKTNSEMYDIKIWVHPEDGGTLRSIWNEIWAITWVTGVFLCPKDYTDCWGKNYTINERYINWEKRWEYKSTGDRVVFGWDKNIVPLLFQTDKINKERENEIWEWFANHPLILKEWKNMLSSYHEKWLIDYKMKSKAPKNFICSSKPWDAIYFWIVYDIDIDVLAEVLQEFWCHNAVNLDAGASTAFLYNSKYIVWPQRELLDWVFIVPKNLDISEYPSKSKTIINHALGKLAGKDISTKIIVLEKMLVSLTHISSEIYKKNTIPLYDTIVIYKDTLIVEDIKKNLEEATRIVTTTPDTGILSIKNNNLYKKEIDKTEKTEVWTRVEISSKTDLSKLLLTNHSREYLWEIIKTYKSLEKFETLRKMEWSLDIEIKIK